MASPVRYSALIQHSAYPFPKLAALQSKRPAKRASGLPLLTALSVEFVAKPQEAHRVEAAIPAAIASSLKDVAGFAGCLVMISDQEARLVTVVTLWAGEDRAMRCSQNARWVQALLVPYLDRCLRVRTMVARLPVLPMIHPETGDAGEPMAAQNLAIEDETVPVA